ncbi:MAG: 8-oxo-dGTP diphosphatase [Proteobacteria bacterium]|nr:8-oxo-dGTP diphosphatase [Pseudomonadota bacterium]
MWKPFLKQLPTTLADVEWQGWQPTDPATLLFIIRDGEILLIRKKRGLGAGKINGPGGKLEGDETPLQCALRETHEELGIHAISPEFCGEHQFQFVDGYSLHVHVYRAADFTGQPVETDEAIPLWFPLDAIPYAEMWMDDRIWLPLLIAGEKFFGRWLFDEDKMLDYQLDHKPGT